MKSSKCKILSALNRDELWNEFCVHAYPKWATLCLLKYLRFNVLDSLLIERMTTIDEIHSAISSFSDLYHLEKVLVRTDKKTETGNYMRGGNSLKIEEAMNTISDILRQNRTVIVTTPTNRFTNKISLNLGLSKPDCFIIEALGPGFDVSDLNRGIISPLIAINVSLVNWDKYEHPNYYLIERISNAKNLDVYRQLRLNRISKELLPAMGIILDRATPEAATEWLEEKGFTELFEDTQLSLSYSRICELYEIALIIGLYYGSVFSWNNLVISASDLGEHKGLTYWDIANPRKKFAFSSSLT